MLLADAIGKPHSIHASSIAAQIWDKTFLIKSEQQCMLAGIAKCVK